MGLFDLFRSRKKTADLAQAAFLHILQRFTGAIPRLDEILGLQVLMEGGIGQTSKGFKIGLIKNRAFLGVFLAGAFNARYPDDPDRFALLFQAISGSALQGLVEGTDPDAIAKSEIAPDLGRFMWATFDEGSSVLSTQEGLLATLSDEQHAFALAPLAAIHNLYHEVYLACFGEARYLAISKDGMSLRNRFQKEVQNNVQHYFKMMRDVCDEIDQKQNA